MPKYNGYYLISMNEEPPAIVKIEGTIQIMEEHFNGYSPCIVKATLDNVCNAFYPDLYGVPEDQDDLFATLIKGLAQKKRWYKLENGKGWSLNNPYDWSITKEFVEEYDLMSSLKLLCKNKNVKTWKFMSKKELDKRYQKLKLERENQHKLWELTEGKT